MRIWCLLLTAVLWWVKPALADEQLAFSELNMDKVFRILEVVEEHHITYGRFDPPYHSDNFKTLFLRLNPYVKRLQALNRNPDLEPKIIEPDQIQYRLILLDIDHMQWLLLGDEQIQLGQRVMPLQPDDFAIMSRVIDQRRLHSGEEGRPNKLIAKDRQRNKDIYYNNDSFPTFIELYGDDIPQ